MKVAFPKITRVKKRDNTLVNKLFDFVKFTMFNRTVPSNDVFILNINHCSSFELFVSFRIKISNVLASLCLTYSMLAHSKFPSNLTVLITVISF